MTQEERKILLRDLCAKAPYNLTFRFTADAAKRDHHNPDADYLLIGYPLRESPDEMIPFLRSLSSMTEKEQAELRNILGDLAPEGKIELNDGCLTWNDSEVTRFPIAELVLLYDWLDAHFFDYRIVPSTGKTLIASGLALEAPKDMYKFD